MRERTLGIFCQHISLLEIVDRQLDQLEVASLQLVGQPVLEAVNVADGLEDDVQLGHIVLGGDTRYQLLQSAIRKQKIKTNIYKGLIIMLFLIYLKKSNNDSI